MVRNEIERGGGGTRTHAHTQIEGEWRAVVAQWLTRSTSEPKNAGSTPATAVPVSPSRFPRPGRDAEN